jgi:hypothetical protein
MRIVAQVQRLQQMAQQMKFVVAIEENSKYKEINKTEREIPLSR